MFLKAFEGPGARCGGRQPGTDSRGKRRTGRPAATAVIWLVAGLLGSCASLHDARLPGMVYSRDGKPLQGVAVLVDGVLQSRTDANGRFVLNHPLLELQRETPWQAMALPVVELELAGYRSIRIVSQADSLKPGPEQLSPGNIAGLNSETVQPMGPALWCRMSSARDLMHDAWDLMERGHWVKARDILREAAGLDQANRTIRQSLELCDARLSGAGHER